MTTLKQNSRMRGLFMIERQKHNPDGSPIPGTKEVVAPWQDNLILDSGLDNLGGSNWMRRCDLGAGSSPPAAEDTALESLLGTRVYSSFSAGPTHPDYASVVGEWVFPQGEATGIISELGVGPTSGFLTTRALVRDENGAPTTITKGPIDSLTVTYMIREYPDKGDQTYEVTNPHTSQVYSVTSRTIGGTGQDRLVKWHENGPNWGNNLSSRRSAASSDPMAPWDSTSYTNVGAATTASEVSYIPGSYYRDLVNVWNEGSGNLPGGIVSIRPASTNNTGKIQAQFDPPIDKDDTKTLSITTRKSWGRYVP